MPIDLGDAFPMSGARKIVLRMLVGGQCTRQEIFLKLKPLFDSKWDTVLSAWKILAHMGGVGEITSTGTPDGKLIYSLTDRGQRAAIKEGFMEKPPKKEKHAWKASDFGI